MALLWFLAATLSVAAPEMIPEDAVQVIGRTAPEMVLPTLDGGDFDLAEHRGKPVVLAFWASWCGPCRRELPALDTFAKERGDIAVFAVNVDRERRLAQRFMERTPFDLPVVWDNESLIMGQLDVVSMPSLFLIDARGTIKWRKAGFNADEPFSELKKALAELPR